MGIVRCNDLWPAGKRLLSLRCCVSGPCGLAERRSSFAAADWAQGISLFFLGEDQSTASEKTTTFKTCEIDGNSTSIFVSRHVCVPAHRSAWWGWSREGPRGWTSTTQGRGQGNLGWRFRACSVNLGDVKMTLSDILLQWSTAQGCIERELAFYHIYIHYFWMNIC